MESSYKSHYSRPLKVIALALILCFSLQEVSQAADISNSVLRKKQEDRKSQFLPRQIQEANARTQSILEQKRDLQNLQDSLGLEDDFTERLRARKKFFDEDKRRGGAQNDSQQAAFQLEDTDGDGQYDNPNDLVHIYEYQGGKLWRTATLQAGDVDIARYIQNSEDRDGENGEKIRIGTTAIRDIQSYLNEDLVLSLTYYNSEGQADYTLSGFDEGSASQVSWYIREGGVLKEVKTYGFDGAVIGANDARDAIFGRLREDLLIRLEEYEGEKDKERIKNIFSDYAEENGVNTPHSFETVEYDANGDRKGSRTYDISEHISQADWASIKEKLISGDAAYDDEKTSEKIYSGVKKANRLREERHYEDGELVARDEYEYDSKNRLLSVTNYDADGQEQTKSFYDARERVSRVTNANGQSILDFGSQPRDPREMASDLGVVVTYMAGHEGDPDWIDTLTYPDGSNYQFVYVGPNLDTVYFAQSGAAGNTNKITTYKYEVVGGRSELSLISYMNHLSVAYEYSGRKLSRTMAFRDSDSDGRADGTERVLSATYYNSLGTQILYSVAYKSAATFDDVRGDNSSNASANSQVRQTSVYQYYANGNNRISDVTTYRGAPSGSHFLSKSFYNNDLRNTIRKTIHFRGGDNAQVRAVEVYNISSAGAIESVVRIRGDLSDEEITALKGADGRIDENELLTHSGAESFTLYIGRRGQERVQQIKQAKNGVYKQIVRYQYNQDADKALDLVTVEDAATGRLKTKTFYVGFAGSEIADYSLNYAGDGTTVRSVSVNWYQGPNNTV
ncbi:MAG: RHS repeat protein, partial [Candidatus Omnitrophica bacterium]|nr:RHS repeat protein [Candidatus Omnitrophota bacterium]